MKKLIILLLLAISLQTLTGQACFYEKRNISHVYALYVALQPVDYGFGLRYDYAIISTHLYSSITYGNWGLYKWAKMNHHVKITTGLMFPLKDELGNTFAPTIGLNYHLIGHDRSYLNPLVDREQLTTLSFELGFGYKFKRFAFGCRTDILRWEPGVDVGFTF